MCFDAHTHTRERPGHTRVQLFFVCVSFCRFAELHTHAQFIYIYRWIYKRAAGDAELFRLQQSMWSPRCTRFVRPPLLRVAERGCKRTVRFRGCEIHGFQGISRRIPPLMGWTGVRSCVRVAERRRHDVCV